MATAKNNAAGEKPRQRGGRNGIAVYSRELEDQILSRIANGDTLNNVCRAPGFPTAPAVRNWILNDRPPGIAERYAHARRLGYEAMADELFAIADDTSQLAANPEISGALVAQQRLAVDTRKWFLSKALPHRFGDRVEVVGNAEQPLVTRIELVPVAPRLPAGKTIEHDDDTA